MRWSGDQYAQAEASGDVPFLRVTQVEVRDSLPGLQAAVRAVLWSLGSHCGVGMNRTGWWHVGRPSL